MWPVKQIFLMLHLLGLTCAIEDIICPSNNYSMYHDVHCLRNHTQENAICYNDSFTITWDYGDQDKGEIHFTILGRMCNILQYSLDLYRIDNSSSISVDSHTAKEVMFNKAKNNPESITQHSIRDIKEENLHPNLSNEIKLPSCAQIRNVTFTFMYKGCYILIVKNYTLDTSYISDPICITTNFMKESLYKQKVTLFSEYEEDLAQVNNIVSNFSRLQVNKMILEVWRKNESFTHCNGAQEKITSQTILLQPSGVACSNIITAMPCRLERENDRIECTIHNVTNGCYCFLVKLQHDPCLYHSGTVWGNKNITCYFSGNIVNVTMVKKSLAEHTLASDNSRAIILMAFIILLFIAFIAALVFFLYNKWIHQIKRSGTYKKAGSPMEIPMDIRSLAVKPQIYLMYSRDCQPFMDVMKTFRSLLMEVLKCEVYDCFDSDSFEDIARIGVNWPGKLLANDNVRVVLVETRCAKLHLEAYLEDFKIDYKDPTPWDNYFMYGLKAVMHNPKYNSYQKLFITRIHGFISEEDKLKEITPYIRYDIPDDFHNFLSSILQQFNLTVPYDWNYNINELQDAIKNLQNYKKINENYIDNFLIKRKKCIDQKN